jgi:aspartyl protease family protein
LILGGVALLVTHDAGTIAGISNDDFARLVVGLSILVFLGGAVTSSYSGRIVQAVKHLAGWTGALFVLLVLYAYRGELAVVADRVIGELTPQGTQINVTGISGVGQAVRIKRGWSGHFVVTAEIRRKTVEMIVDTGASTVVLRDEDARRLGINTRTLRYSVPVQTANGSSHAARVYLEGISVGNVGVRRGEARIARPGSLHQSLLGVCVLSRLRADEFTGES